ncbi:hypothetical protein [Micromonospora humi]|uniref:Uncharacterized protein n=1 Tax=Micromonospora humi TaxID=745366 RepID=A0A1C5IH12_9ACTN|nr:hypothetical protein [Micromonospora humi]SCG57475.1 hypothetical protein GA0070213_105469 [Micromonospora humi]
MDATIYAAITEMCARLAGRLPDDALGALRDQYAAGEWAIGDDTLLLSLAFQHVGITAEEQALIRSFLSDPDNPDLLDVPVVDEVPAPAYRFTSAGPAGAADPSAADRLLAGEAPRHGGRRLHRAWRSPLGSAPDGPTWVYVLRVVEGADELKARSGLTARLWTTLREKWPVEVVAEGSTPAPYQAAALAAAQPVWSA